MTTFTKGIWVYPKPLFLDNKLDCQYMILDVEGIDGIREEKVSSEIKN